MPSLISSPLFIPHAVKTISCWRAFKIFHAKAAGARQKWAVADFRSHHLDYAASDINKQQRGATGNDVEVGTGGTPFMRYLKKHCDETRARLLSVPGKAVA